MDPKTSMPANITVLPSHIAETVDAVDQIHADHHLKRTVIEKFMDDWTAWLGGRRWARRMMPEHILTFRTGNEEIAQLPLHRVQPVGLWEEAPSHRFVGDLPPRG
jgi:hypothetical protein